MEHRSMRVTALFMGSFNPQDPLQSEETLLQKEIHDIPRHLHRLLFDRKPFSAVTRGMPARLA